MKLNYIRNDRTIFAWVASNGNTLTGSYDKESDPVGFNTMLSAIESNDIAAVRDLITLKFSMIDAINTFGRGVIAYKDGVLYYLHDGIPTPIDNNLAGRIRDLISAGIDATPLIRFLENLVQNPSQRAIEDFYDFLLINNLTMTDDGHFIAYKIVRSNFKDIYTGTMDNSPGVTVRIDRSKVDSDPNRTCSAGLHICSKDYLPQYGGFFGNGDSKIIAVKVNPKHVVAFPKDYAHAKARVCEYTVLGEFIKVDPEYIMRQIEHIESLRAADVEIIKKLLTNLE